MGVKLYIKALGTGISKLEKVFTPRNIEGVTPVLDRVSSSITNFSKHFGKRIEALKNYKNPRERSKLFCFNEGGEIAVLSRGKQSSDLMFLDHVKTGNYVPPKMYTEGTNKISQEALKQSNKLAKDVIPSNEKLVDGFRYHGPQAQFDEFGKDISRFRSGNQEITIIDRKVDSKLAETIQAFKARIEGKNLSEQEKMQGLLKYVDEVFSVKATGTETDALVHNMHAQSFASNEVFLGDVINSGAGVCRHRSLLTKVLGDEVGLQTAIQQGHYGGGGHAWNEITTKNGETILFDAMHGSMFNVSNTSKSVMPQVFSYKITSPQNADKLVSKYFDPDSSVGIVYRKLAYGQDVKIQNFCEIKPSSIGGGKFEITPTGMEDIFVNGHRISDVTLLHADDWVQIKSLGFQI